MTTLITTVHADPDSMEGMIKRLTEIAEKNPQYKTEYTPEAVLGRLKRNLQSNSSPAISYLKVGKEDAKILIELLDKVKAEE